jgi:hypothetical protein
LQQEKTTVQIVEDPALPDGIRRAEVPALLVKG